MALGLTEEPKMRLAARRVCDFGLVAVLLAGCAAPAGADKAGGEDPHITLVLGAADSNGHPDTPLLEYFARQVAAASDGHVHVRVEFSAAGDQQNSEAATVDLVRDGSLDLGWVGARVWDTQGVSSFQALQAPFLITDYRLLDEVVTGPIPGEMLDGLKTVGMVGLGLYPDELRHPVGLGAPLLSLADFRGAKIRTPVSNASDALLRALGSDPLHLDGSALPRAIANGELRGLESSAGNAFLPGRPVLTANITFYPKTITLFGAAARLAELSAGDRDALVTAARRTLDFAVSHPPEARSARALCRLGGAVLADRSDVAEIVRAAHPLYPLLERDPRTRSFIGQIRQDRRESRPVTTPIMGCASPTSRHRSR
jgi:TRAP-type C4-dicarboxylate transport system substrate-binding protein